MSGIKETVIVTGASRGIGKAIALKFAEEGYNLALFGRNENDLKQTAAETEKHGVSSIMFTGDVADQKFVFDSVEKVYEKFGNVDHLINNAGVAVLKKFVDVSLDEFKTQVDANMYGIFNFTKAVITKMIEKKNGSVINISSLAGKISFVGGSTYGATKHAVMGFTKSLFLEVREFNIRVAAVCPGSVATDMIMGTMLNPANISKVLDPRDIADVVYTIIKLPVRALVSEVEVRPTNPR